jgi:hypothetical protein
LFSSDGLRAKDANMLIDDFADPSLTSKLGTTWKGVSDQVMGGVSEVAIRHETGDGENCLRLTGDVRLVNNGGFVQAALNLAPGGADLDASSFTGLRLTAKGNAQQYSLHLRTPDNIRPWQSYRVHFVAQQQTQTFNFPFTDFEPYRIDLPLDITRLRRLGAVAIGRQFQADLFICRLEFYK